MANFESSTSPRAGSTSSRPARPFILHPSHTERAPVSGLIGAARHRRPSSSASGPPRSSPGSRARRGHSGHRGRRGHRHMELTHTAGSSRGSFTRTSATRARTSCLDAESRGGRLHIIPLHGSAGLRRGRSPELLSLARPTPTASADSSIEQECPDAVQVFMETARARTARNESNVGVVRLSSRPACRRAVSTSGSRRVPPRHPKAANSAGSVGAIAGRGDWCSPTCLGDHRGRADNRG